MNIIWDFDGVIADSELIWLENRRKLLNEKLNLGWDLQTTFKHIGGMSDMGKKLKLEEMGIKVEESFWQDVLKMDYQSMLNGEMIITPNVIEMLKAFKGRQCIATGGILSKTKEKVEILSLQEFFNDKNMFTADMVNYGKPEPDVFLLAQESMGWDKKDCVIIEDSIPGMIAGQRAGIKTLAFIANVGHTKEGYAEQIKTLGITDIFDDMLELKKFVENL